MKKFIQEFKEFINKGNVVSMAVGIMIGGAFNSVINSVVENLFSPIVAIFKSGTDLSDLSFNIGEATFNIGLVLDSIISFLITALVLFWIVKGFNKLQEMEAKKLAKKVEEAAAQEQKAEEEAKEEVISMEEQQLAILKEIRDSLQK